MIEHAKHPVSRTALRERIIDTAVVAFSAHGIKSITMDDIATSLGISKRTLYEVFADKESLLEECILKEQNETEKFIRSVLGNSKNVLEVLLKFYQRSIEKFHSTNKRFFEDIKKYPKAYELMRNHRNQDSEESIRFFMDGVRQGIFRDDVNFALVNMLVREQLNLLLNTDICKQYSFLEVYESIMFTYLRGISTERGARELEAFISEYRRNKQPEKDKR